MKGDFTRSTFKKEKHYRGVCMQQGRVQMDADWNEQIDMTAHRVETETVDVVGCCGAPMDCGGFHLVADVNDLDPKEKIREENKLPQNEDSEALQSGGDFYISGGRYYVDGILCENEQIVPFSKQPDGPLGSLPKNLPDDLKEALKEFQPPDEEGTYLAYLDVWSRHITALEDPEIREKALGGPDTATRTKTVWQVRLMHVGGINAGLNCLSDIPPWEDLKAPTLKKGTLAARAEKADEKDKPCALAPRAGYRRLENQLYRVEVHKGGTLDSGNGPSTDGPTFKWSRDNGSIVTEWTKSDVNKLTVAGTGRDKVLNFAGKQWVELTDDTRELLGQPGTLVKLEKVEGDVLTIDPNTATGPVDRENFSKSAKVRRWDQKEIKGEDVQLQNGAVEIKKVDEWIKLEDGVQVKFSKGTYKTGDYWLIPARTANADVEWPVVIDNSNDNGDKKVPMPLPPHGIKHHFCKLALLEFDGSEWTKVTDCRQLFPPVTKLTSLLYVGGDGQEAMPEKALPKPLRVRVANGQVPVNGAKVRFTVAEGGGTLSPDAPVSTVAPDGTAECSWTLGAAGAQQVKAELLDLAGQPVRGQILEFNANLSVATDVAYDPKNCADLSEADNVQKAIDKLCERETKGGCATTVGPGGQFETLEQAFEKLKDTTDVCLCLLPGSHKIDEDLVVSNKNSIKIVGCGAAASVINQNSKRLSLRTNQILLQDVRFTVAKSTGEIVLNAKEVTAERCAFERTTGSKSTDPLVLIGPVEPGKSLTDLHWRHNRMVSTWVEKSISPKIGDFLIPTTDVGLSAEAKGRLEKLSKMNPYIDRPTYIETLEAVAEDLKGLSGKNRKQWSDKRPEAKITDLPAKPKTDVTTFFDDLKKTRITTTVIGLNLGAIFESSFKLNYDEALALQNGVGGWIEDNIINGHVSLYYVPKAEYLKWRAITSTETRERIRTWFEKHFHIEVDRMALNLRGNSLQAVRSNGPSTKQIDSIFGGKFPKYLRQEGYGSITVAENLFDANSNSFICESLIMNGNTFADKADRDSDIAAFVLGYSGIFVGNLGSDRGLKIETMLRTDRMSESANILSILGQATTP